MMDVWACTAPGLAPLRDRAQELAHGFDRVTYVHIPRELNSDADALANLAMDSRKDAEEVLHDVMAAYVATLQAGPRMGKGAPGAEGGPAQTALG